MVTEPRTHTNIVDDWAVQAIREGRRTQRRFIPMNVAPQAVIDDDLESLWRVGELSCEYAVGDRLQMRARYQDAEPVTVEITDIRMQRLHDMTDRDAAAEGVPPHGGMSPAGSKYLHTFRAVWDTLKPLRYSWQSNPWVWVIEFRRISTEGEPDA